METKRYNAYNSTRGTVLNAKLAVADRQLEPLKFLELLIGGLGLDSESGLWLKPLACAPQVPRVFPFDMVYLDHNQKVIQAAEVFPSGDFPTFSEEVVSALILPLHAASSTQTRPGDQLLVRAEDQLSEQPQETPHQAPEVPLQVQEAVVQLPGPSQQASEVSLQIQEVVLQSAESSQQAAEAPLQIHEVDPQLPELPRQPPESSPTIQEASPQTSPAAASSSKFLYEPSRQSWELPLEGFWAPQSQAPESVTEAGKSAIEPGDRAKPAVVTLDHSHSCHSAGREEPGHCRTGNRICPWDDSVNSGFNAECRFHLCAVPLLAAIYFHSACSGVERQKAAESGAHSRGHFRSNTKCVERGLQRRSQRKNPFIHLRPQSPHLNRLRSGKAPLRARLQIFRKQARLLEPLSPAKNSFWTRPEPHSALLRLAFHRLLKPGS